MNFSCVARNEAACTGSYSEWAALRVCLCFSGLIWWRRSRSDASWMSKTWGLTSLLAGWRFKALLFVCAEHISIGGPEVPEKACFLFLVSRGYLWRTFYRVLCTRRYSQNGFLVFFFFQCSLVVCLLPGVSPPSRHSSSSWL